jgi:hypothetical protein
MTLIPSAMLRFTGDRQALWLTTGSPIGWTASWLVRSYNPVQRPCEYLELGNHSKRDFRWVTAIIIGMLSIEQAQTPLDCPFRQYTLYDSSA